MQQILETTLSYVLMTFWRSKAYKWQSQQYKHYLKVRSAIISFLANK